MLHELPDEPQRHSLGGTGGQAPGMLFRAATCPHCHSPGGEHSPACGQAPARPREVAHCHECGVVEVPATATIPYCEDCWQRAVADGRVHVRPACLSEDGTDAVLIDGREVG